MFIRRGILDGPYVHHINDTIDDTNGTDSHTAGCLYRHCAYGVSTVIFFQLGINPSEPSRVFTDNFTDHFLFFFV